MNVIHLLLLRYHSGDGITSIVRETQKQQIFGDINAVITPVGSDNNGAAKLEFGGVGLRHAARTMRLYDNTQTVAVLHGVFSLKLCLAGILSLLRGHRVFVTPHSSLIQRALRRNGFAKFIFYHLVLKHLLSRCAGVIFLNENEMLQSKYPSPARRLIIDNALELDVVDTPLDTPRTKRLVFFGRYDIHHKGIDILLDQYSEYVTRCLDAKTEPVPLHFYGSGNACAVRDITRRHDISQWTEVHGPRFGESRTDVLLTSELFVLFSRYEGTPMAVLEAMSYGALPIVSEGTNLADVIEKYSCGWVTDSSNSLTLIMDNYMRLTSSDIQKMRSRARLAIQTEYNWSAVVRKQKDLLFGE